MLSGHILYEKFHKLFFFKEKMTNIWPHNTENTLEQIWAEDSIPSSTPIAEKQSH